MQGLLEEFDPLSIKEPISVKSPQLVFPSGQPKSHLPQSNVRTSHHSAPLFSIKKPESCSQDTQPTGSTAGIGRILPSAGRLSVNDNDPLGLLSTSDEGPSTTGGVGLNRRPDELLAEAQRRSKIRQEALARHLAHEPFQSSSSPTTTNSPPLTNSAPLINLESLNPDSVTCFLSPLAPPAPPQQSLDSPNEQGSPPPATMKIPTDIFQNCATKVKNTRNSHLASPPTASQFGKPTAVDRNKLAAALGEDFDDFVSASSSSSQPVNSFQESLPKRTQTSPPSLLREFDVLRPPFNNSPLASGRSTPSFFEGPEGRPAPIRLRGIKPTSQVVMDDELAEGIRLHLPPRLRIPAVWDLLYSIDQHGTSLGTLYQRVGEMMAPDSTAGCVLAIQDSEGNRFGAFVNEAFRPSKEYYGSGECFLWKGVMFEPGDFRIGVTVRAYLWTGANDYMVLSDHDDLSIGGGDGKFGLWIDSGLQKGASEKCPAFNNEILCCKPKPMEIKTDKAVKDSDEGKRGGNTFDILGLECWKIAV